MRKRQLIAAGYATLLPVVSTVVVVAVATAVTAAADSIARHRPHAR